DDRPGEPGTGGHEAHRHGAGRHLPEWRPRGRMAIPDRDRLPFRAPCDGPIGDECAEPGDTLRYLRRAEPGRTVRCAGAAGRAAHAAHAGHAVTVRRPGVGLALTRFRGPTGI